MFLIVLSGCVPENINKEQLESKNTKIVESQNQIQKTDREQPETKDDEISKPQVEAKFIDPEQSEMRISEMTKLQKQIQDIDSELSILIQSYRENMSKLKSEREVLEKKLNALYEIEKEVQSEK